MFHAGFVLLGPKARAKSGLFHLFLHLHRNEDHDNIYDPVSPYNVVMTPRRSQRNCSVTSGPSNNSTMAMPQQQGATVQDQRPLPSLLTASDPSTSPALTTTTLPRLSRRAATEDDADSRFVLNWYVALGIVMLL